MAESFGDPGRELVSSCRTAQGVNASRETIRRGRASAVWRGTRAWSLQKIYGDAVCGRELCGMSQPSRARRRMLKRRRLRPHLAAGDKEETVTNKADDQSRDCVSITIISEGGRSGGCLFRRSLSPNGCSRNRRAARFTVSTSAPGRRSLPSRERDTSSRGFVHGESMLSG